MHMCMHARMHALTLQRQSLARVVQQQLCVPINLVLTIALAGAQGSVAAAIPIKGTAIAVLLLR